MVPSKACSSFIGVFVAASLTAQVPTVLDVPNPAEIISLPRFSAELSAFAFSDPVSLKAFGERWQGSFTPRGGEQGFLASLNTSVACRKDSVEIKIWHQQRVLMSANRDTVDFLHKTKGREDLPIGRTYDLDMVARGIRRTGATLSQTWTLSLDGDIAWSIGAGGKGWYADQAQSGQVVGQARATGVKSYDFDLAVDYRYTKNLLYNLIVPPSKGVGLGGVLGTSLHSGTWSMEAAVDDIGSRTWWVALPFTKADAKSQRQHYDPSGYLQFDPTIVGIEGEKDWIQRTPTAWMARGTWGQGPWRLGSRVERISTFTFYALEGSLQLTEFDKLEGAYEPRTRSWGLGWIGRKVRLGIAMQAWNVSKARSLGLSLGWNWGSRTVK